MSDHDPYEKWRRKRASEPVPDGFADRVMDRLATDGDPPSRMLVPILVCTTAAVAGLTRVAAVLALFKPTLGETNTEVVIDNDSTELWYEADLSSLKKVEIPAAEPDITLDWSDSIAKSALGAEFIPTYITEIMVAHYSSKTPADLEEQFLDIEIIADDLYRADMDYGTEVNLSLLTNEAKESFAGIDDEGTWIVALMCGSCANPAPWFISIFQTCVE